MPLRGAGDQLQDPAMTKSKEKRSKQQTTQRKRQRQAADLPNKCKAFPLFCRTWLQDRDLPKEERFKQASAAWKSLTEESREAWNAKAKETQLAWKSAALQAGLYHRVTRARASNRLPCKQAFTMRENSAGDRTGADDLVALPQNGLNIVCGEYSWTMSGDQQIGDGTFGDVYKGMHAPTEEPVAIKVYKSGASSQLECAVLQELAKHGAHAPFPQFLFMAQTGPIQAIVMELFDSDLYCLLHASAASAALQEKVVKKMIYALMYLHHKARLLHLDVKCKNVLISQGGPHSKIVLCDFSTCEQLPVGKPAQRMYCTLNYRPPEFLVPTVVPKCLIAAAADWWSLGCLVWEVATNGAAHGFQHLFHAKTTSGVLDQCSQYIEQVHSGKRVGPSAFWPARLHMAGPVWAPLVKTLCHSKPGMRTPKFEIPSTSAWR